MKKARILHFVSIAMMLACLFFIVSCQSGGCVHMHSYAETVVPATCDDASYTLYRCPCGDEYRDGYVQALGHDYGEVVYRWSEDGMSCMAVSACRREGCTGLMSVAAARVTKQTIVAPTCENAGEIRYTAYFEGDAYPTQELIETVDQLPHSLLHTEKVDPTCTKDGHEEYWECEECHRYFSDPDATQQQDHVKLIPAKDHVPGNITEGNGYCGENPVGYLYCAECGECIGIFGHRYESVTTPATCTENGHIDYECRMCHDTYSVTIPATGHYLSDWKTVTPPTCTEEGTAERECLRCGTVVSSSSVDMTGHDYLITVSGDIVTLTCTVCDHSESDHTQKRYHTVRFLTDNTTEADTLLVPDGDAIGKLPAFEKEGAVLVGWFLDAACTVPYEGQPVTSDMTLYAGWRQDREETSGDKIIRAADPDYTFFVTASVGLTDDNVNDYVSVTDITGAKLPVRIVSKNENGYEIGCSGYESGGQYTIELSDETKAVGIEERRIWLIIDGVKESVVRLRQDVITITSDDIYGIEQVGQGYVLYTYRDILKTGDKLVIRDGGEQEYQIGLKVLTDGLPAGQYYAYAVEVLELDDIFDEYEVYYSDTVDLTDTEINPNLTDEVVEEFMASETYRQYVEMIRRVAEKKKVSIKVEAPHASYALKGDTLLLKVSISAKIKLTDGVTLVVTLEDTIAATFRVDYSMKGRNTTMLLTTDVYNTISMDVVAEYKKSLTDVKKSSMDQVCEEYKKLLNDMCKELTRGRDYGSGKYSTQYEKTIGTLCLKPGLLAIYLDVGVELEFSAFGGIGGSYTHRITVESGMKDGEKVWNTSMEGIGFSGYIHAGIELYGGVYASLSVVYCGFSGYIKTSVGGYAEAGGLAVISKVNGQPYCGGAVWAEIGVQIKLILGFKYEWRVLGIRFTLFDLQYKIHGSDGWKIPIFECGSKTIPYLFEESIADTDKEEPLVVDGDCSEELEIDLEKKVALRILIFDAKRHALYSLKANEVGCLYGISKISGEYITEVTVSPEGKVTIKGNGEYLIEVIVTAKQNSCLTKKIYIKGVVGHTYTVRNVTEETERAKADCLHPATYWYTCEKCGTVSHTAYFDYGDTAPHTPDETYTADDGHHWHECTTPGCDYRTAMESHSVITIAGEKATCTTDGKTDGAYCEICGYVITASRTIPATGHHLAHSEAKDAACTVPGNIGYWYCTTCGSAFLDAKCEHEIDLSATVIAPLGHDMHHYEAKAPTCTEQGWEAYDACSRCEESTRRLIDPKGHTYGNWHIINDATCTEAGAKERICTECGTHDRNTIAPLGHTAEHHAARPETCTEDGNIEYWYCTTCERVFTDARFENETDLSLTVIAGGHIFDEWHKDKEATCIAAGTEIRVCGRCGETETRLTPRLSHVMRHIDRREPTCTEPGSVEFYYCSACERSYLDPNGACVLTEDEIVIAALGHAMEHFEAKEATCTEYGWDAYDVCGRCGESTYHRIEPSGHAYGEWSITREATCTDDGAKSRTCGKCDHIESAVIEKTGHAYGEWNTVRDATCSDVGFRERTCGRCGIIESLSIAPLGHTMEHHAAHSATCVESGNTEYWYCTVCQKAFDDAEGQNEITLADTVISALGHDYAEGVCSRCGRRAESSGLDFTLSYDKSYYILSGIGSCTDTDVVIPSTYLDMPVRGIGRAAFSNRSNLTSVTIPDGVTYISEYAFSGCTGMKSVIIPNSVTAISYCAFSGCSSLENVIIPENITSISTETFYNCSSLTEIIIPDNITSIGYKAFYGCSNLETVTIYENVEKIDSLAFFGCNKLKAVYITDIAAWCRTIFEDSEANPLKYAQTLYLNGEAVTELNVPMGVSSVGKYAFAGYSGLTSIVFSESVTTIGDYAFRGCRGLVNMTISDGITSIGEYSFSGTGLTCVIIPKSISSVSNYAFMSCSNLRDLTIADGVVSIGIQAFSWCENLTTVIIPDSVSSIGRSAFCGCKSLVELVIPRGIITVSESILSDCWGLESVTIPEGVTSIEAGAFSNCYNLQSIYIPIGVTSIGGGAFSGCNNLTRVVIPDGVISIGKGAFRDCKNLLEITIPFSVTSIGTMAFSGCTKMNAVYISDVMAWMNIVFECSGFNVTASSNPLYYAHNLYLNGDLLTELTIDDENITIGKYAFYNCASLTSVRIAGTVDTISDYAFYGCAGLISVIIQKDLIAIGDHAFAQCVGLKEINIPESVASIGYRAFECCSSLLSIKIPESITVIGSYLFYGCTSLTSVTIPSSITSIGSDAFYNCRMLKAVYITDIAAWCRIVFENSNSNPLSYAHNLYLNEELVTDLTIPDDITIINNRAFYGCRSIKSLTISEDVTTIGDSAFANCVGLVSVTIPNSVTSIGGFAFQNCTSLVSVMIPNSVTSISNYAFSGCTWLTNVTISSSVTAIGNYAFGSCYYLTEIHYDGTMEQWNAIEKGTAWNGSVGNSVGGYTVHCTDGDIENG